MHLKGTLILLFLISQASPGLAQFKNTLLHEVTSAAPRSLAIAVNPRTPQNIVVMCGSDQIFYSKDAGQTWAGNALTSPAIKGHAVMFTDDKATFRLLHVAADGEHAGRMVIRRSDDAGESWSAGEPVMTGAAGIQRNHWATRDAKGNLYLTWAQPMSEDDCPANLYFSMSKNGKKWSDPTVIAKDMSYCAPDGIGAAIPTVTYDGKVMIAWSDQNKVFLDRSFNGGEWWLSNDITVADQVGGAQYSVPGVGICYGRPVLTTDHSKSPYRGSLYIVWADQRNGEADTDVLFTRSHNFGDNWSLPSRVGADTHGRHQYMPWVTVDPATGYLYILYYDRSAYDDNRTDVYLAWSVDGGASFQTTRISERPFLPEESDLFVSCNSIAAQGGVIATVWSRVDDGKVSVWTSTFKHEDLPAKR